MKDSIIMILIIFAVSLILCSFGTKMNITYDGKESIEANCTSKKCVMRVSIEDSYTMDGENYYVLKTNETEDNKFVLSEKEYNKYIGIDNNAVEGYIYRLELKSELLFKPTYKLITSEYDEMTDEVDEIDLCSEEPINLSLTFEEANWIKENAIVTSEIAIYRYSFLGESDFTEKDIEIAKENFNADNFKIIEYFKQELKD